MVSFLVSVTVILAAVIVTVNGCSPADRAALLAFKEALREPYHGVFNTWSGNNCCLNWYGVSCDATTGRVTDINLRGESEDPIFEKSGRSGYMTGKISPQICKLDRLTTLIVADWKAISGEIPPCVTSLSSLRILDLIGNQLSGEIPCDVGKLQRLTVLNLADNSISGEIPASVTDLASLMHLDFSNNKLTGSIPAKFRKTRNVEPRIVKPEPTLRLDSGFHSENLPSRGLGFVHEPVNRFGSSRTRQNAGSF